MSRIEDLFRDLPPNDRAELAYRLLLSLESDDFDAESETAWAAELETRLAHIETGNFQARDWREALDQMRQSLARKPTP